jgi:hypothetical protein
VFTPEEESGPEMPGATVTGGDTRKLAHAITIECAGK